MSPQRIMKTFHEHPAVPPPCRRQAALAWILAAGLLADHAVLPAVAESGCGCSGAVAAVGGNCDDHGQGPNEQVTLNLSVCIPPEMSFYYSFNNEQPALGPFQEAGVGYDVGMAPLRPLSVPTGKPFTLQVGDDADLNVTGTGIYSAHISFIHGGAGQPVGVNGARLPSSAGQRAIASGAGSRPSDGSWESVNPDGSVSRTRKSGGASGQGGHAAGAQSATAGSDQVVMYFRVSQTSEWQRGSSFEVYDALDEPFEFMLVPSAESGGSAPGKVSEALVPASGFQDDSDYAQSVPRFYLGVGLGFDSARAPCGMLVIDHPITSSNAYSRSGLEFRGLDLNDQVTIETESGTQNLNKVVTPDLLIEIEDDGQSTNAYIMSLYSEYSPTSGGYMPVGNPYKTIAVGEIASVPNGYDHGVRLTIIAENTTRTIEYYADDEGENWRRVYGDGDLVETANSLIGTQDVRSVLSRVWRKNSGGTEVLAEESLAKYELGPLGEVLMESILDPSDEALTTSYTYYTTNDPGDFAYGQTESIVYPDGNWVKYEYLEPEPDSGPNYSRKEYRPWMDSPSSPANAADSNCVVRTVTAYGEGRSYHARTLREEDIETKVVAVRGVLVGKERNDRGGGDLTPAPHNRTHRYEFTTPTHERKKEIVFQFKPDDPEAYRADKVWGVHRMDGAKSLYDYSLGDYDAQTGAFDAENCTDCDALRVVTTTGYADGFSFSNPNPTNITLVAYESTKTASIFDKAGNLMREEQHVFTGGTNFALMTYTAYEYDEQERLTSIVQDGREIHSIAYNGLFETSVTDESGLVTITTVNEAGEVVETVRQGVSASGAYDAQPDVTTTIERLGGDVTTTVSAGLLTPLATWQSFDLAGRLRFDTDEQGRMTSYEYDPANRIDSVIMPGGVWIDTLRYLDGQTAAVTNDGTVARFFDYGVEEYDLDGDGTEDGDYLVTTQRLASGESGSALDIGLYLCCWMWQDPAHGSIIASGVSGSDLSCEQPSGGQLAGGAGVVVPG
jgi:hypothetical protein